MRDKSVSGEKYVRNQPLVDKDKTESPLIHNKFRLMINSFKLRTNMVRGLSTGDKNFRNSVILN